VSDSKLRRKPKNHEKYNYINTPNMLNSVYDRERNLKCSCPKDNEKPIYRYLMSIKSCACDTRQARGSKNCVASRAWFALRKTSNTKYRHKLVWINNLLSLGKYKNRITEQHLQLTLIAFMPLNSTASALVISRNSTTISRFHFTWHALKLIKFR
jgi:hypothetical protein